MPEAGAHAAGPLERIGVLPAAASRSSIQAFGLVPNLDGLGDHCFESVGIEVDVGYGGKKCFDSENVYFAVGRPSSAARWAYIEMPLVA